MTVLVLSLVLAAAGCTGLVLAGRGMWQGWAVGLAVQPVWALFALVTHGYGLLVTCLMYGTVYGRNLLAWRRRTTQPPAPVEEWTPARCVDWVAGYEYALRNWIDEGVQADLRKLTPAGVVVPSRPSPTTGVRP